MLASLIFMKHHVNAHCGWISPQPHSLCPATGEANTQCLTVEEAGLSWKNTPRTWIPIQNFFFLERRCTGDKHLSWIFVSPL